MSSAMEQVAQYAVGPPRTLWSVPKSGRLWCPSTVQGTNRSSASRGCRNQMQELLGCTTEFLGVSALIGQQ